MDNRLNDRALTILQGAPVAMLLMGFWQLGNPQMFFNQYEIIEYGNDTLMTNHKVFGKGIQNTYLVFLVIFIAFKCIARKLVKIMKKKGVFKQLTYVDDDWNFTHTIDEKLGDYYQSLSGLD